MPETVPSADLLSALGRLVRGLSALFWGLPISLVVCVQTARGDLLQSLGILPPMIATALLLYGLELLGHFQKQERVWQTALDRAKIFGLINIGLSPFLYWWNRVPAHPFYGSIVEVMILSGLLFLFCLNPMLWRLAAMLPDETLRLETKTFTTVNRYLLLVAWAFFSLFFVIARAKPGWLDHLFQVLVTLSPLQNHAGSAAVWLDRGGTWGVLFLVLLPVAMTMALIWKIKEAILASVFGSEH